MVKIIDGLKVEKKANWYGLGKIIIHYNDLDDLKLNVKYASGSPVPKIKRQMISEEMAALLMNLIDTSEINFELGKQLSDYEKDVLSQIMKTSGLGKQLSFTKSKLEPSRRDLKIRYNVLVGEFEAGNNSPEVIKELMEIMNKLVRLNVIDPEQKNEMIDEINKL